MNGNCQTITKRPGTAYYLRFDTWILDLHFRASREGLTDLLGSDYEHRDSYASGFTPQEELERLKAYTVHHAWWLVDNFN